MKIVILNNTKDVNKKSPVWNLNVEMSCRNKTLLGGSLSIHKMWSKLIRKAIGKSLNKIWRRRQFSAVTIKMFASEWNTWARLTYMFAFEYGISDSLSRSLPVFNQSESHMYRCIAKSQFRIPMPGKNYFGCIRIGKREWKRTNIHCGVYDSIFEKNGKETTIMKWCVLFRIIILYLPIVRRNFISARGKSLRLFSFFYVKLKNIWI